MQPLVLVRKSVGRHRRSKRDAGEQISPIRFAAFSVTLPFDFLSSAEESVNASVKCVSATTANSQNRDRRILRSRAFVARLNLLWYLIHFGMGARVRSLTLLGEFRAIATWLDREPFPGRSGYTHGGATWCPQGTYGHCSPKRLRGHLFSR